MRYKSHISNLVLFNSSGTIEVRFGQDGVLNVGTLTTNVGDANIIDYSNLLKVYDTDLDGNTVTTSEMCGLGSLDKSTKTGGTLTNVQDGYRLFFECPPISTGAGTVDTDVEKYIVLTGSVTYNGVTYNKGDTFIPAAGVTETSGTGTFAIEMPDALTGKVVDTNAELFDEAHLIHGDEANTEWSFNDQYGAQPYDSLVSTDEDHIGWTR